jgi:outer membrane beta-barrel protein
MGKGRGMTTTKQKTIKRLVSVLAAVLALFAATERAEAQQILLTGPLAGAPAVRKLRLHRKGRLEVAPAVSFTLLDEYQRTILVGAKLNYHFVDWLAIGAWGAFGAAQMPTHLSDQIQEVNAARIAQPGQSRDEELTAINLGPDFKKQLGSMDWVVAPQLTAVPFRGKLALFQSIYLDTDLYFFGGPAFVGLTERANCETCTGVFTMASRTAIAPTFGLGFNFYINKWSAIGFEYRALPFSWNTGGFDTAGGGQDKKFPDNKITNDDRQFHFNSVMTLSFNMYLPFQHKVSE